MNFDRKDNFSCEEVDHFPANELPYILRPKFTKMSSRYHKFMEVNLFLITLKNWYFIYVYKIGRKLVYSSDKGLEGQKLAQDLYNSTVENWVRTINEGRSFDDVTGRPVLLIHEQLQTLCDEVEIAQGNQNCMTYSSFMREMVQSSVGTVKVSILTIESYLKQMSWYAVVPEETALAKIIGSQDLVNAVSQTAILSKKVKDQNIHSCDCNT